MLCSVVIGRQPELQTLTARLEAALAGRGGLLALTGEPGIGKSRLAAELAAEARKRGALVAVGRAVPAATADAYRPLTEAMLQALRSRPLSDEADLAAWLPALTAVVPTLGHRNDGHGNDGHGDASPAVRGEALIRLLRKLAGDDGVVIVLEDLHWSDPDTLAVVEYLGGNLGEERTLCVITSRSEPLPASLDLVRRLRGRPGVAHLPLSRFDDEQVARMVQACDPAANDETIARVQRSADGIPLLVEEMLASPGVPESFAETVTVRLAEFGADERSVLEASALLGRRFDWDLLPLATGLSRDVVVASLQRAVECLLVTVDGDRFRFRHALTREAVLEAMLPPRRAETARRCLAAVDDTYPYLNGSWREVAADLAVQAGEPARAGSLLVASGRSALDRGALATCVEALRYAISILPGGGDVVIEAERNLLEALALAGRVDEALAVGSVLIRRLGDDEGVEVAQVHLRLAHAAISATRWPVAVANLDAAKALLAGEDRPDLEQTVAVLEAEAALAADDVDRARTLADAALASPSAGPEARCQALEVLGRAERLADLDTARRLFERGLAIAEENELPFWRLRALHELGTIELFDRFGSERLTEALQSATELGALSTIAVVNLQLSAIYNTRFSLDAGTASAGAALELAERLGLDEVRAKALCFLAENNAHRCRREEMERYVTLSMEASSDPGMEGFAWGARGMLGFLQDDRSGAIDALDRAVAILTRLHHGEPASFRSLWPLLLASAGDRRAGAAIEDARRLGIARATANRAVLAYAEAILAGRRRQPARADELADAAGPLLAFAEPWGHFARLCSAEPALADGWGKPKEWLADAGDAFTALGLTALAQRCGRLLGAPQAGAWSRLGITAREAEVLSLVADGLTNKEIAGRLALSHRTVEKHLESLMRKTGSRTRTQLAVTAGLGVQGSTVSGAAGAAARSRSATD